MEGMLLRKVELRDLDSLTDLYTRSCSELYLTDHLPNDYWYQVLIDQLAFIDNRYWILIDRETDDVVGAAAWKEGDDSDTAYLHSLVICMNYRRQGWGRVLTSTRLSHARTQGYKRAVADIPLGVPVNSYWSYCGSSERTNEHGLRCFRWSVDLLQTVGI
jgi:ribosomal protein S18 acetylase RimI-like enzyme